MSQSTINGTSISVTLGGAIPAGAACYILIQPNGTTTARAIGADAFSTLQQEAAADSDAKGDVEQFIFNYLAEQMQGLAPSFAPASVQAALAAMQQAQANLQAAEQAVLAACVRL
jgi:hypothetical protein